MPHSYNKTWIHAIWSTKLRQPFIVPQIETIVFDYLRSELREMNCPVRIINGMPDHVHCLFLLSQQKSIAEVIKRLKGNSSHFVNQQNLVPYPFSWQTGYATFSVSESILPRVFEYIQNQKTHHQSKTYDQELRGFLKLHGLEFDQ